MERPRSARSWRRNTTRRPTQTPLPQPAASPAGFFLLIHMRRWRTACSQDVHVARPLAAHRPNAQNDQQGLPQRYGFRRDEAMDLARTLKIESVCRLNPTPPWHVQPQETVADAVELMREKSVGCVLVCEGRKMIGIFTERDLLQRVMGPGLPLSTPVLACMTPAPVSVHPRDSIA